MITRTDPARRPGAALPRTPTSPALELDLPGCPMSHANRQLTSAQDVFAPERVDEVIRLDRPGVVSARSGFHLGAFSAPGRLITMHPDPLQPAIAAYDPTSLRLLWTSPRSDLPADRTGRRRLAAPLLFRTGTPVDAATRVGVITGNPTEFIAYDDQGREQWRRPNLVAEPSSYDARFRQPASRSAGGPICLNHTDSGHLVTITDDGWLITLDPWTGHRRMIRPLLDPTGRRRGIGPAGPGQARLGTGKSVAVVGQVVYALVAPPGPGEPVFLARCEIASDGRRLTGEPELIMIGRDRAGGSPCVLAGPGGRNLIIANAEIGPSVPIVVIIEDVPGKGLQRRWWSIIPGRPGDVLHTSPAIEPITKRLVVTTRDRLLIFPPVDQLEGRVIAPAPMPAEDLLPRDLRSSAVEGLGLGSPVTLGRGRSVGTLLITNLRLRVRAGTFGHLVAVAVPDHAWAGPRTRLRPLWAVPLSDPPAPGPGTFGQAAVFTDATGRSGVLVTTAVDGTFCIKGPDGR
jgi:hypothetical protein